VFRRCSRFEGRGRDLFDAAERLDLEGMVAKRKTDPFRPETVWYKIKSRTYTGARALGAFPQEVTGALRTSALIPPPPAARSGTLPWSVGVSLGVGRT
jgi:hypothetical protein